jgi:hypothetical protein
VSELIQFGSSQSDVLWVVYFNWYVCSCGVSINIVLTFTFLQHARVGVFPKVPVLHTPRWCASPHVWTILIFSDAPIRHAIPNLGHSFSLVFLPSKSFQIFKIRKLSTHWWLILLDQSFAAHRRVESYVLAIALKWTFPIGLIDPETQVIA